MIGQLKPDLVFHEDLHIQVRNSLFMAASRTYAEQYIEPLLRTRYSLSDPDSNDHDAVAVDGTTFEIKACKVLRTSENRAGSRSLLERVLYELGNQPVHRLVPFSEREAVDYDANVQNVKRDHFDILLYALLFEDSIKIFEVESSQISTGSFLGWSDKHGRYDALGKSGQFTVNKRTVSWHVRKHLKDTLSYQEVTEIFKKISTK